MNAKEQIVTSNIYTDIETEEGKLKVCFLG